MYIFASINLQILSQKDLHIHILPSMYSTSILCFMVNHCHLMSLKLNKGGPNLCYFLGIGALEPFLDGN